LLRRQKILAEPWYRFRRVIERLDRIVNVHQGSKWLDLGCHQGQFLKLAFDHYQINPFGVDNWGEDKKGDGNWWSYNKRDLGGPFNLNERYEFISALEVIEHIIDTDRFLEQVRLHLDDRGYFMVSTPNINSLRNRICVPLGAYPAGLEYRNNIHHVRLYNVDVLKSQFIEHGLQIIEVVGVSFFPMRILETNVFRTTSEWLANRLPQYCGNIIAIAKKC
jgi:2-polyprenyl-3-methyl-5-hydroxy-6-metoxy-1,4-benzoquinol methylase